LLYSSRINLFRTAAKYIRLYYFPNSVQTWSEANRYFCKICRVF